MNDDNHIDPEQVNLEELKLEWDAQYMVLNQKQDDLLERISALENLIHTFRSKGANAGETDLEKIREYFGATCKARDGVAAYLEEYTQHVGNISKLSKKKISQLDDSLPYRLVSEDVRIEIGRDRLREVGQQLEEFERFLGEGVSPIIASFCLTI